MYLQAQGKAVAVCLAKQTVVCIAIGGPLAGRKEHLVRVQWAITTDEANWSRSLRLIRCRARLKELAFVAPSLHGSEGDPRLLTADPAHINLFRIPVLSTPIRGFLGRTAVG